MKKQSKFIMEENLNRLAKWVRMIGCDVVVYKNISLQKMINIARKEKRVFVTRSKKKSNLKLNYKRWLIRSDNYLKQLEELKPILQPQQLFSRCIKCNRKLNDIHKSKTKNLVPDKVYRKYKEYKICRRCGKIFWKGTHYQKMLKKLKKNY